MTVTCPECDRELQSYKGYGCHFSHKHKGNPLVALHGGDTIERLYRSDSENKVAEALGVSRTAVQAAIEHLEIDRRGQSEAEQLKWAQMSAEEREQQVRAAHERTREMVEDGGHVFHRLWDESPEFMQEQAVAAAALGAPARTKNGMAGVAGQDHPNWRGGKSIYDAVKKQLRPSFHSVKEEYRKESCGNCGRTAEETGRTLDVHHIVPLLCGGTNDEWNMMTLCMSCHHKAEWYTRGLLDPVLTA